MSQIILNGIALADLLDEFRAIIKDEVSNLATLPPSTTSQDTDRWEQGVGVAAEELGWAKQTVYQNIDRLPRKKLHGKLYFNRKQLREFIAQEGRATE